MLITNEPLDLYTHVTRRMSSGRLTGCEKRGQLNAGLRSSQHVDRSPRTPDLRLSCTDALDRRDDDRRE